MDLDDGLEDDEPVSRWVPPDDRLWRHPSEVAAFGPPPVGTAYRADRGARPWTVALLAGMIGSLLTAAMIAAAGGFTADKVPVRTVENVAAPLAAGAVPTANTMSPLASVVEIADRVRPSIVQLDVDGRLGSGSGSGIVFRSGGYILTNNHVVEGASEVIVVTADAKEIKADVIGGDPDTDVAVVKIDRDLPPATLGSASALKVGQPAVAIGSPLGLAGGPSVSVGVVSALGRQVEGRAGTASLFDMIQTDAPIAPGSSGGALVDGRGSLIGVTTAIAVSEVGAEGLGFATPIDIARDVAEQLITNGKVTHVWLGIQGEDLDSATAQKLGIDGGALVRDVSDGSPADQAGLEQEDVITHIDGKEVGSMAAVVVALRGRRPGDQVEIQLRREGATKTLQVQLAERPKKL
jgi:S1-C subfamily serine protease